MRSLLFEFIPFYYRHVTRHSVYRARVNHCAYVAVIFMSSTLIGLVSNVSTCPFTLRKHAYPNILKISPPKTGSFQTKNTDIFHISAQNIDCGYSFEPPHRGGSNEYPHSMFLSRNMKNNVYPCKPQFYYIKVGFKEVKIT